MSADSLPSAASGLWSAPADQLAALAGSACLVPLPELGVIAVSGEDAGKFLQGQLTNDVLALADGFSLNGYCSAKGRLLASFHQWRDADTIYLQLPTELLPAILKRLSMFVLRAKVKLVDDSARWRAWGLLGQGAAAALVGADLPVPASAWAVSSDSGVRIVRLPGAPETTDRFLLVGGELPAGLASVKGVEPGVWWWSEIASAVPTVWAATQEKFVPQMINFEVLGGVNFKKGCYPGQEIVARSQYLGKLRRRMAVAHVDDAAVGAGADVFAQGQAVGTVVMVAAAPGGGFDLLFESPVDAQAAGGLSLGAADGPALTLRALPYELFDPTA